MTVPEVAMVMGIRAAIGVGTGLLLADAFSSREKRRAVGRTLLLAGVYAGGCLMAEIFGWGRAFRLGFGQGERGEVRGAAEYWPHESETGEAPVA
jgi:hypothetical protein